MEANESREGSNAEVPSDGHQEIVNVPTDLLATLVASVDGLRKELQQVHKDRASMAGEVSQLRSVNTLLAGQVEKMKKSIGVDFDLFPKFPREIREMIWAFALTEPQIHIFGNKSISRSKVNTVMQACREVRAKALALELPYYQVSDGHYEGDRRPDNPKYYFNPAIDTIWLPDKQEDYVPGLEFKFIPGCISFFCSKCGENLPLAWDEVLDEEQCSTCERVTAIKCLAVNYSDWKDPDQVGVPRPGFAPTWSMGTAEASFWLPGVQEIKIVVNDNETGSNRDVSFIKPGKVPWRQLVGSGMQQERDSNTDVLQNCPSENWDLLAEERMSLLEDFKPKRAEFRRVTLAAGHRMMYVPHGWDVSEWRVPPITYVEARNDSQRKDWMLSP